MALLSKTGCCRRRWNVYGASSPVPTRAIDKWSTSSMLFWPTACLQSRLPAPRQSSRASILPMSFSTSWPASVIHLMERTQLFDLMGELKLYGMKAAFDEIMATAVKRQHETQRNVGDLLHAEL